MSKARFSIGIDLGTTSSVMAFQPLQGGSGTEVFSVVQWLSRANVGEAATLPSFLYLPEAALLSQYAGKGGGKDSWIIGHLARAEASRSPGRVVHSAKSWLCHHASDRTASFLPFGSEEIAHDEKISPLRALALILNYFSGVWNDRFAASGDDFSFEKQSITITVPASFDAVAQRLTLMAARDAGYPDSVRLIEEPQAAFYRWLERHPGQAPLWSRLPADRQQGCHVVVIDIGGGTSDFSLFSLERLAGTTQPSIRRVAVSEHILLGGDNIDLAIAHRMQSQMVGEGGHLTGQQWDNLVARSRDLKEKALADDGPADEYFSLSISGRGSSLVASALSARITRGEIHQILFDGFFPECSRLAVPEVARGAFKEWGLPYAADSAITRHLAAFLQGQPRVDAVLFNGGTLFPAFIRSRLTQRIQSWQEGVCPLELDNPEPHLAVALGAARYGRILHAREHRIEAGAPRAIFLEVHRKSDGKKQGGGAPPSLVCILPRGARSGERFDMTDLALSVHINRPVRFQSHYSLRGGKVTAGTLVDWNDKEFHPLVSLETIVQLDEDQARQWGKAIPVALSAEQNELGLLQVLLHSQNPELTQVWPLEFNLRPHESSAAVPAISRQAETTITAQPNVSPEAMDRGVERIEELFSRKFNQRDKLTATRLNKSLEELFGRPRGEWNWVLVRGLWETLHKCSPFRGHSIDHEETWLIMAGYFLRPGFGAVMDEQRIDVLWRILEGGPAHSGKRIRLQEHILWRRVAGGLDRQRQERLFSPDLNTLRSAKNPSPELIRLSGSLERLGHDIKGELIDLYIHRAVELLKSKQYADPYINALGLLLNRAPLHAGPEAVVSPEKVEQAFSAFSSLDWSGSQGMEMQTLFLQGARVVDNRSLDLPAGVRKKVAAKLEKSGVTPLKASRLLEFYPLVRADRVSLYGESLPPGLFIGGSDGAEGGEG
ncbi:MAG: Hsp70 family protein [Magnetococcales bacterium]|nr:Hsp70 family protein [Magnetococcales bacterium]